MLDVVRHGDPYCRAVELARRYWGVVTGPGLVEAGIPLTTVRSWVRRGRLLRLHRAVYALGHDVLRPEGYRLAAVLACGPGAALSHAAAADHLDLRGSSARLIDVSATAARRPRNGIRLHRPRRFDPGDVIDHRGIPTTSVTRTVIDMAPGLPMNQLENLVANVEIRGLLDHGRLAGARSRKLATIIGRGALATRSPHEVGFVDALRATSLPRFETNVWMTHGGGEEWQADVLFRRERVIVEIDDDSHRTRKAFEQDRHKDVVRQADGFATLRFTRRQLREDVQGAVALLARTLDDRASALRSASQRRVS
ncbi:MAG: type IV toxin-antitoxin system AbiEi family antitoxin domain-containing protein [Solirubrobacteraceae bacterium]